MTDDLTETLAAWKATADGATEGPWCHYPEAGWIEIGAGPDESHSDKVLVSGVRPAKGWDHPYEDKPESDAEFIALSRIIVPALLSAVESVLALCSESDNRRSPFVYASEVRKALTDALGAESEQ